MDVCKTLALFPFPKLSGIFESWMYKLVSAVMQREVEANVVVVDWLSMAQQLYPDAVNHTRAVGQDIATLLNWLQVQTFKHLKINVLPAINPQLNVLLTE